MGSRNTSVRTGRQKVSQVTDNTRPPGLTTLVPVRLFRDFTGKTKGSFRTNPTSAAVLRQKNHVGIAGYAAAGWHNMFGEEEYGHGNYASPVYDAGSGEFSTTQYTNASAIGGSFASADARIINDATVMTDAGIVVLDTKLSRDGRYTYVLSASLSTAVSIYFNVYDNATGSVVPTTGATDSNGHITSVARFPAQPAVSAWGSICVVDDTTTEDSAHHMSFNSCMFGVQCMVNTGGGNFEAHHSAWRYDYAAGVVDEMYGGGSPLAADFTTTASATAPWCEMQLVTQTAGTLQAMIAWRSNQTATTPDTGVPHYEMWTTFSAGDNPTSGPESVTGGSSFDFGQPPTTAVSRRGAPTAGRRLYVYYTIAGAPGLNWVVINPATFFAAGVVDQSPTSAFPTGTTYVAAKACALPPAFVDGSNNPHMFVAFVYKNTTSNITNIQCFIHTTVTTGSDTAPSLGNSPPGITVVSHAGAAATAAVGVAVSADPAGAAARASMVYLNPSTNTYTLTEATCTDPTDMTKIFPQVVLGNPGSTNALLNTPPTSNTTAFAYGHSYWDFNTQGNKNDMEALAFLKSDQTQAFVRVVTPWAAIAVAWDADVYENLPNPTDANTNGRTTTVYARGTGANDGEYLAGAMVVTFSETVPGYTATTASNTADLTGVFAPLAVTVPSPGVGVEETSPVFVHPAAGLTGSFTATMADEFTFNISSWTGNPMLNGQVQAGMTIGILDPISSSSVFTRYTIQGVIYSATAQAVTQITVAQPAPFHANALVYDITVSAGPSTGIRQLITAGDGELNNRTGNVVFPTVVQLDYASIETNATHSEIAEVVVPFDSSLGPAIPTGCQIQIRGYNLNNLTLPSDIVNGIMVGVSLDAGTTWLTKSMQINTTPVHGHTMATSFGAQAFIGASDLDVPWASVPAGIAVGDYLTINTGVNEGRYVVTAVTNDTNVGGPRIFIDRPFPVPGNSTVVEWFVTSAKDDYESAGTSPDLGFGSFGMNFDLTALPVSGTNMHVRVEFKDGTTGHDITYEIDSISVQWSP